MSLDTRAAKPVQFWTGDTAQAFYDVITFHTLAVDENTTVRILITNLTDNTTVARTAQVTVIDTKTLSLYAPVEAEDVTEAYKFTALWEITTAAGVIHVPPPNQRIHGEVFEAPTVTEPAP